MRNSIIIYMALSLTLITTLAFGGTTINHGLIFNQYNYVNVTYSPQFYPTTWTIDTWVKVNSSAASGRTMTVLGTRAHGAGFGIALVNGVPEFINGQGNVDYLGSGSIANGGWHEISVTYDGTYLRIYQDGNLTANDLATTVSNSMTQFYLGADINNNLNTPGLFGIMSETRMSKTNLYTTNFIPSYSWAVTANTIAYWPFNDGSGTVLHDASGNGHPGTLQSAAFVSSLNDLTGPITLVNGTGIAISKNQQNITISSTNSSSGLTSITSNDSSINVGISGEDANISINTSHSNEWKTNQEFGIITINQGFGGIIIHNNNYAFPPFILPGEWVEYVDNSLNFNVAPYSNANFEFRNSAFNPIFTINTTTGTETSINDIIGKNLCYANGTQCLSQTSGVNSLNTLLGPVNIISGNSNIIVATIGQNVVVTGNYVIPSFAQTYGVNTINALLGAVTIGGDNGIYARTSGQNILIGVAQASTTTNGFLSFTDWNTFNNKLSASTANTLYSYKFTTNNGLVLTSSNVLTQNLVAQTSNCLITPSASNILIDCQKGSSGGGTTYQAGNNIILTGASSNIINVVPAGGNNAIQFNQSGTLQGSKGFVYYNAKLGLNDTTPAYNITIGPGGTIGILLAPPVLNTATATTGGVLGPGTYYVRVSSIDTYGSPTGVTTPSNQKTVIVSGSNDAIAIGWTTAQSYDGYTNIYLSQVSGSNTANTIQYYNVGGGTYSYTITGAEGSACGGPCTVPTINTARTAIISPTQFWSYSTTFSTGEITASAPNGAGEVALLLTQPTNVNSGDSIGMKLGGQGYYSSFISLYDTGDGDYHATDLLWGTNKYGTVGPTNTMRLTDCGTLEVGAKAVASGSSLSCSSVTNFINDSGGATFNSILTNSITASGQIGISKTISLENSILATCTLTVTNGIITGDTC